MQVRVPSGLLTKRRESRVQWFYDELHKPYLALGIVKCIRVTERANRHPCLALTLALLEVLLYKVL